MLHYPSSSADKRVCSELAQCFALQTKAPTLLPNWIHLKTVLIYRLWVWWISYGRPASQRIAKHSDIVLPHTWNKQEYQLLHVLRVLLLVTSQHNTWDRNSETEFVIYNDNLLTLLLAGSRNSSAIKQRSGKRSFKFHAESDLTNERGYERSFTHLTLSCGKLSGYNLCGNRG